MTGPVFECQHLILVPGGRIGFPGRVGRGGSPGSVSFSSGGNGGMPGHGGISSGIPPSGGNGGLP